MQHEHENINSAATTADSPQPRDGVAAQSRDVADQDEDGLPIGLTPNVLEA